MKYLSLFESKSVSLPKGCEQLTYRNFLKELIEAESNTKYAKEQDYEYVPFENFSSYELNKLKSIVYRFDGYFSTANNDNPLFLHSVFDPNSSPYILAFKSEHKLKIPQLVHFNARRSKKSKNFNIAKKEDGWFLVHIRDYHYENKDWRPQNQLQINGGMAFQVGHGGADTKYDTYYRCDQFETLLEFIIQQTKMYRTYNREEKSKKFDRDNKLNKIVDRLKSMNWEEFNSYYNDFMK